jgi:Flp pilus assembly protein TadD
MRPHPFLLILVSVVLVVSTSAQRRGTGPAIRRGGNITIHVVLPGESRVNEQLRVQLMNPGGTPVGERFTTGMGEAQFSGVAAGNYEVRVSGIGIEDATARFELSSFEGNHIEYVHVTPRNPAQGHRMKSPEGTISAHALNVPEKARRELDKGNEDARHHNWKSAEEHYRKALVSFPDYSNAYNNLGVVCMQLKDYACARDSWQKATVLDPENAQAFVNLARLRTAENNYPDAEPLLQKALGIEPLNPEGLLLLANAELMLGKFDQALLYARKVHTIPHQSYASAHLIAGNALEAEHQFNEAADEYRMVLQESPHDPAADRARECLERLYQPVVAKQR